MSNDLDPRLVAWAGECVGAQIEWCEPHAASGRSRLIWVLHRGGPAGARPLLLRSETGHGPFAGTEFTLGREANVLRALAGTNIPVPAVHGVTPDGATVLMDLLPGNADLDLASEDGIEVLTRYTQHLAELHQLDATKSALPQPKTPAEHALIDITTHQRSYLRCVPHPAADDALRWLATNAPGETCRTSLLHGDAGPGNFLHDQGRVTGLIDWEMAHIGDPMDDLAWLWFRIAVLATAGGDPHLALRQAYRTYCDASGLAINAETINYYGVAVLTRCLIATLVRAHNNPRGTTEPVERMARLVSVALNNQSRTGRVGGEALPEITHLG